MFDPVTIQVFFTNKIFQILNCKTVSDPWQDDAGILWQLAFQTRPQCNTDHRMLPHNHHNMSSDNVTAEGQIAR